jgi:uncharacterized ion transporter superfamily protein YfcC
MKRVPALVLLALFSLTFLAPAYAQRLTPEQTVRQSKKAGKKQQKMLKKSAKQQRKAMKRSTKASRKATKKANRALRKRQGH